MEDRNVKTISLSGKVMVITFWRVAILYSKLVFKAEKPSGRKFFSLELYWKSRQSLLFGAKCGKTGSAGQGMGQEEGGVGVCVWVLRCLLSDPCGC